jgi:hypothetical protein
MFRSIHYPQRGGSNMRRVVLLVVLAVLVAFTASCVAGPNALENSPDEDGKVSGFWQGLWHGLIAPIMFIVSLFNSNVHIYAVHSNGAWYNVGFLLGMSTIFGGGCGGAARRQSRRRRATE